MITQKIHDKTDDIQLFIQLYITVNILKIFDSNYNIYLHNVVNIYYLINYCQYLTKFYKFHY